MNEVKNSCLGLIFDVQRYSIHDGPGIRTTVFFKDVLCGAGGVITLRDRLWQGVDVFQYKCMHCGTCTHVCPMGAIEFDGTPIIRRSMCIACGSCSAACPSDALKLIGREYTVGELMKEIERDVLYFDNSGGGVTFSGGEPLYQHEFLLEMLKECKKIDIHRTLDTSGFAPQEVLASVADYVDLFLYDLKLIDEKEHIKYTGVSNAQIKENLRFLVDHGRAKDVIIRFPVIPEISDTADNVEALAEFISPMKGLKEIDLLPFHDISEKYNRLDKDYKMTIHKSPSRERLLAIKVDLKA